MRLRHLLVVPLVAACIVPARASVDADWHLVRVVAGPEGAEGARVEGGWRIAHDGSPLMAYGFAAAFRGATFGYTQPFTGAERRITTTSSLGGIDVAITQEELGGEVWASEAFEFPPLEPGESASFVWFNPGFVFVDWAMEGAAASGSIDLIERSGSGAAVLRTVKGEDGGVAVAITGSAAVGDVQRLVDEPVGIAGAFVDDCLRCSMAWHAPDGVSGGHTSTSFCLGVGACVSLNDFPPAISGPGGSWSWSWLGVADFRASTILGAYAPVGDDWAGFRP